MIHQHHPMIGTSSMDSENQMAVDGGRFAPNCTGSVNEGIVQTVVNEQGWVDLPYAPMPPMHPEYASPEYQPFGMHHGLPSEALGNRIPPASMQSVSQGAHMPHQHHNSAHSQLSQPQHHHPAHPQLHQLIMPSNPTWPSQLTNPGGHHGPSSYSAPPLSMAPVLPMPPLRATKTPTSATAPRKTLTDEDRRRICEFAEQNKGMKQTEIGAQFGVERSTISKTLTGKDKWYKNVDKGESSTKRAARIKPSPVDVEKAVYNWIKKAGVPVSDTEIQEKAKFFAQNPPGSTDASLVKQIQSAKWLEKFKKKYQISPRLLRRASENNIGHRSTMSPASPHSYAQLIPSPLSTNMVKIEDTGDHCRAEVAPESASSSFSASSMSSATFTFSPNTAGGGFLNDQSRHLLPGGPDFQRPRSQTFPTLDIESMNQPKDEGSQSPQYAQVSTAPSSALESPMHEMMAQPFAVDTSVASTLRRASSTNSLVPRSTSTTVSSTPGGSSPNSPTHEDASRAADLLLSYIQNCPSGSVDRNEYSALVSFAEKLRLSPPPFSKAPAIHPCIMGGLARIPEGEATLSTPTFPKILPRQEPQLI